MKYSRMAFVGSLVIAARASPLPQDSNSNVVVDSAVSDAALRNMPLTRDGMTLRLNGTKWQSSGANVYWLGLVSASQTTISSSEADIPSMILT